MNKVIEIGYIEHAEAFLIIAIPISWMLIYRVRIIKDIFVARYFIPITGMILGNSLNHNIVGLTTYYEGLRDKSDLFYINKFRRS